jgi:P-type Ca2+ transporter type 2C
MLNKNWHSLPVPDVLSQLQSTEKGLTSDQAKIRLTEYGYNELQDEARKSPWLLLLEQFKNLLIIILLVAVILSAFLGEVTDAIVIFIIVVFAAGLGFIQEYRAEKAIQALKKMAAPLASALRNGEEREIPARELVPGDVIVIRTGDKIPADARVITDMNLRTEEAALTGESLPVDKSMEPVSEDAVLGDRLNMLFMGTVAVYGRCTAVVVSTGATTEFGKIAGLLKDVVEEKTPLQVNLDKMGKWIAIAALSLCFVLAVLGVLRGHPPLEMLIWGVSLAVAAVPEALPAVVTISLALGVSRMVKRHALVRKLPAVETLGCTTVICSDKTGTMTQDQMTMRKIWVNNRVIDITGSGYDPVGSFLIDDKKIDHDKEGDLLIYLKSANLCSDTRLIEENGQWRIKGDPTEGAFVVAAVKAGLPIESICSNYPRVAEIPFTSETKRMTAVCQEERGTIAYSNGAAEVILNSCDYIYIDGRELPLSEEERGRISNVIHGFASSALRVLGTAYKKLPADFKLDESVNKGMVLLGLAGMIDPPRPEVKASISTCKQAGIKTVMITGDHKLTAVAIARELGILDKGTAVTGTELNTLSQAELETAVRGIEVYARVSPEHKLRVVEALAKNGHVVAMTGDGINDAPALKKADIGIAMGIKGTDVTKEAADMILTDDNFASIVAAVEEGRNIFENIKKFLMYLLSCNIGEILVMAVAVLFGPLLGFPAGALPLIAIQILYVNLATDGLPAIALCVDPPDPDIMKRKPRPRNQTIFTRPVLILMLVGGIWSCIVNLAIFKGALMAGRDLFEAQAFCFATLVIIQFFAAYNFRSDIKSVFTIGMFNNKWLNLAVLWECTLLLIIFSIPALEPIFHTLAFNAIEWAIVLLTAGTIFPVLELTKVILRRYESQNNL